MEITLFAPVKINLSLHITGKRPNGYHDLVTIMQPLDIGDELTVSTRSQGLEITCNDPKLASKDNLVVKAAEAWFKAADLPLNAQFHLEKKVPVAAGLGGGSSDAAACLIGLNALHGSPLPALTLYKLACNLGADIPFFLSCAPALCTGIGEKVRIIKDFPEMYYVLVNPGYEVSTPLIYKLFDLSWTNRELHNKLSPSQHESRLWDNLLVNDLEKVTLKRYPELVAIKQALIESGAHGSLMSGSGPTLFGVYPDSTSAEQAAQRLNAMNLGWVAACRGVTY